MCKVFSRDQDTVGGEGRGRLFACSMWAVEDRRRREEGEKVKSDQVPQGEDLQKLLEGTVVKGQFWLGDTPYSMGEGTDNTEPNLGFTLRSLNCSAHIC